MMRRATLIVVGLLVGCGGPSRGPRPGALSPARWPREEHDRFLRTVQNTPRTTADVATGTNGAVTVAYGGFAARAGLEALKQGGNAMDAALTTALTQVALTGGAPVSYFGIMSLVYYDARTGRVSTMSAGWNTVRGEDQPLTIPGGIDLSDERRLGTVPSGRTALVGGFMKGVEAAHRKFGRLPFDRLFEPAIYVAEEGMPVTKGLAAQIAMRGADLSRLPETKAVFTRADGSFYQAGDLFRQPALGRTLRAVASRGADYMYRGPWADKLVAAVRADGGKMALEDLARYDVTWSEPRVGQVGDYQIYTAGPPNYAGVGLIEAQHLAVAAGLTRGEHWSRSGPALRQAVTVTNAWIVALLPAAYRQQLFPGLDLSDSARLTAANARAFWKEIEGGTKPVKWVSEGPKHSDDVVVVDRDGNMAAITHSINCVLWGKTAINVDGISIGDPASFQQAQIAEVGPGRPLPDPTETGLLFKAGRPVLAFASMGAGLHQRTFQALLNFAVFGMTVDQAIDAPDFFLPTMSAKDGGYLVTVPSGRFPKSVLEQMGYRYVEVERESARFGGEGVWVAISRDPKTGVLRAASHNRSNSAAVAF